MMENLQLVHYGPGPTSITERIVMKLRAHLNEMFNVDEIDLVKEHPVFYTKESMHAFVKRNYLGHKLSENEAATLTIPDNFTERILNADLLILVTPMYNFNIPAVVKGWIDNILQSKKLFKYTEYGPIGLSKIEKAIVIPVTGSTPANSAKDFLTPYMDFILKYIGSKEVFFNGIYGSKFLGDTVDSKVEEVVTKTFELLN